MKYMYMYNTVYMYMEYSLTKTKKTARKTYSRYVMTQYHVSIWCLK